MLRKYLLSLSVITLVTLCICYFERGFMYLKSHGFLDERADLKEIVYRRDVMVALTLGQSNSANSGESRYRPHNRILNYANNQLYVANDPLIGAGGSGGSVWGVLGDMLIDSGLYKKVVIVPIGVGSTTISNWADSACHEKLVSTLKELKRNHIRLTHIFWHQGESDLGTSKAVYKDKLSRILKTIRTYGQDAPFYCAIASYHPGVANLLVSTAQHEFIRENEHVLEGPDTDLIAGGTDRFQEVHFTKTGMNKYAAAWFRAIQQRAE